MVDIDDTDETTDLSFMGDENTEPGYMGDENIDIGGVGDESTDPYCMGCKTQIEEGNVVSFGDGIWHVHCFRCAKCRELVEHDSNLLLLSDGNPICENCSYDCHVCKKPIIDEAIMTGDDSFHVNCFRCRQCKSKIENLVFAKTNQGIYCMTCHHERVNKAKRAKENNSLYPMVIEKSLPSLPVEADQKNRRLEPPNHSIYPKRSFERNVSASTLTKTSLDNLDNIQRAHTLPFSADTTINRRHSRLFDASSSISEVFKQKVSSPASKALEQLTKSNGHNKSEYINDKVKIHGESSELSKRAGFFSKKNDSMDNLSKALAKNRGDIIENHSRNASITSSRSEPYDGSGRTFSLSSQRSDMSDLSSRQSPTPPNSQERDNLNSNQKPSSPPRKLKLQNQSLPHIEEYVTNPSNPTEYVSNSQTPRSNSPTTSYSNSPTSPKFPSLVPSIEPTPRKDSYHNGLEVGPPVLPPLSFFNGEEDPDLTHLVPSGKSNKDIRKIKRKSFIGKLSNGYSTPDFFVDNSSLSPERKNSESSLASLSSPENDIIIIEPDDSSSEQLENTKKEAEINYKKTKRSSQKTFVEFSVSKEEFDNEVSLRQKAEATVEELRAQIELQNQDKERIEQMLKDSQSAKQQLQELQNNLKEMSLQKEMMISEIELLAREKQAGLAGDISSSFAKHLSSQFDEVKQNYFLEIRSLKEELETLEQETEQLRRTKEQFTEDNAQLNSKNLELLAMNNELMRQIEINSKGKVTNGFHFFKKQYNNASPEITVIQQKGHSKQSSTGNLDPDCADGTTILSLPNVAHRNSVSRGATPKKFKWKKGGKVLNKILSAGTNVVSDGKIPYLGAFSSEINKKNSSRSHNWQPTSFSRPINCDCCHEKMRSPSEVKCAGCGILIHTKCSLFYTNPCNNGEDSDSIINSNFTSMFGNDLTKQSESEGDDIPFLVQKCILAVEARGMDLDGIYRKSGGASQMRGIIAAFENGEDFDLDSPDQFNDICAVTSVLKQYLRELPDPLLTYDLYPNFLGAVSIENFDEKIERFRQLLHYLPRVHFNTTKYLLSHLDRVTKLESVNLMSPKNLSVVFGPTLLRGPNANMEILDMTFKNSAIEFIIENAHALILNTADRSKDGFI
ncbi:11978_t:CDS:10 [Diversispora eburnea]|uniref:11978_t:CDS:1 n=2 Tax=Diversisporales TaxID=214509 RepID=A0A9N9BLF8_9GLOM|nr:11978_t:CDS:10 [Diversispora eburnea]CAG8643360.1 4535_t:CDS:10 [Dentiscutata erythropus]